MATMKLTKRERFLRLFDGQPVDRVPFIENLKVWDSAIERWKTEGLNRDADRQTVFSIAGFDSPRDFLLPIKAFVFPEFETERLHESGRTLLTRNRWGGVEKALSGSRLMPITVTGPVKDRPSWEGIKERLSPETPGRLPVDWHVVCRQAAKSELPICLWARLATRK